MRARDAADGRSLGRSEDRSRQQSAVGDAFPDVPNDAAAGDALKGVPEIERYELFENPRYIFEVDRRDFVKTFGAGLLVLLVAGRSAAQESGRGFGGDR